MSDRPQVKKDVHLDDATIARAKADLAWLCELASTNTTVESMVFETPRRRHASGGDVSVIVSHGHGCYSAGGGDPLSVSEAEDWVLASFLKQPAFGLGELSKASGVARPNEVLDKLRKKYGGVFAPAIQMPGGNGKGGYRASVVRSEATT